MKYLSLILILFFSQLSAQNSYDALRYSRMNYQGSARFNAMGGAMGALGGDMSSLLINPGAIGVYRNSEFAFTTAFELNEMETKYRNELRSDNKLNLNLNQIGFVSSYKGDPNGWKNYSFSFGYNRLANFNSQSRLNGNHPDESIMNQYLKTLNTAGANYQDVEAYLYPFGPSQAYWIFMLDTVGAYGYERLVTLQDNVEQSRRIETSGRQGETFFSFGGNYLDRLYLGATIGVQSIDFTKSTQYQEVYTYDPPPFPNEVLGTLYQERTELETSGNGYNMKIGAIYRFHDAFRAGLSIHTPTFFYLTEYYSFESNSEFSDDSAHEGQFIDTEYEYRLRTPMRYIISGSYIHKQRASLNAEIEYVDYSTARFNDVYDFEYDYNSQNEGISNGLNKAYNLRLGGEVNFNPFVLRAGYRNESNPVNSNSFFKPNQARTSYSIGSGFRNKNYAIDLSYIYSQQNIKDPIYTANNEAASINDLNHSLMLGISWKW